LAAAPAPEPERWRVFVAIDLPDQVRTGLQAPIDGLRTLDDWVRRSDVARVHLTLHFLGHLPVADVKLLEPELGRVVAQNRRLALVVQDIGAFPNFGRAQVLWAGIAGPDVERLVSLQRELGKVLVHTGVKLEDRFHPHLTLARVRRPIRGAGRELLTEWRARWQDVSFGELPVNDVRLMRSQLGAGPPKYSTIATFSLQ
jgi:RNA 2',3'-cyclic 3'-phosphodiesterase